MWARKTSQGIAKANIRLRKLSVTRSGAAGRESKNYSLPNFITNQIVNSEFIKVENQITLQGQMMFLPTQSTILQEEMMLKPRKRPKSSPSEETNSTGPIKLLRSISAKEKRKKESETSVNVNMKTCCNDLLPSDVLMHL